MKTALAATHKSGEIVEALRLLGLPEPGGCAAHYAGYFALFNAGRYYEAHDALEALWLPAKGGDYFYYKGLIQAAGAFVHLSKGRLRPAGALLDLALKNLKPFTPAYRGADTDAVVGVLRSWRGQLEAGGFGVNPLGLAGAVPRLPPVNMAGADF